MSASTATVDLNRSIRKNAVRCLLSRKTNQIALNLASAGATHLAAGFGSQARGLASRRLDVLFQVRLGLSGLRTRVSPGVLSVSSRTVINNVDYRS